MRTSFYYVVVVAVFSAVLLGLLCLAFNMGYNSVKPVMDSSKEELIDAQQEALEEAYKLIDTPGEWSVDDVYGYMIARQKVDSLLNVCK